MSRMTWIISNLSAERDNHYEEDDPHCSDSNDSYSDAVGVPDLDTINKGIESTDSLA